MSAEEIVLLLKLFDSYWFENGVLATAKPHSLPVENTSPVVEAHESQQLKVVLRKSQSDQSLSSKHCFSDSSRKPVVAVKVPSQIHPHLQTILSGKEVEIESNSQNSSSPKEINIDNDSSPVYLEARTVVTDDWQYKKTWIRDRKTKTRRKSSRSLSDLEYEELKGFVDLGFVFSEDEAKDSRLVSIIPGLQRKLHIDHSEAGRRPYLSEAWDCLEDDNDCDGKKNHRLVDWTWRIPSSGNEMELKDHLRFWAHTVAAAVR